MYFGLYNYARNLFAATRRQTEQGAHQHYTFIRNTSEMSDSLLPAAPNHNPDPFHTGPSTEAHAITSDVCIEISFRDRLLKIMENM